MTDKTAITLFIFYGKFAPSKRLQRISLLAEQCAKSN